MKIPPPRARRRPAGLAGRFAVVSLVAFSGVGISLSFAVSHQLAEQSERAAAQSAELVVESLLVPKLSVVDLQVPVDVGNSDYQQLRWFLRERVEQFPVLRVLLWAPDGTILLSTERSQVGWRPPYDPALAEAFRTGQPTSSVADAGDASGPGELGDPRKLRSFVPVRMTGAMAGPPVAVAEIQQDYSSVQAEIDRLFATLAVALASGLVVLYLVLLPIVRRTSRTVSEQNRVLGEQAARLEALLDREQQTVAELRRLDHMKSDFVAVASHELRSPLTTILGYTKTLRRPEFADDPALRDEFLAAMERQGERLFRLVRNLLGAARLETGAVDGEEVLFDFTSLAEGVREGFQAGAARVRLDVPTSLPVVGRRDHVEAVLSNLLDNALKYSPSDEPVRLAADVVDGRLTFSVTDVGVGIPEADLERVFDRFYQSDWSSTRRTGGVGLGLHLVRGLVEEMGGTIRVASSLGEGSEFSVDLPLVPDARLGQDEPVPDAPAPDARTAEPATV